MAHLVFAMSSWNPGGTYDLPLLSVLSDSWTIQKNLTRFFPFVVWHFFSFARLFLGSPSSGRSKQQLEDQHASRQQTDTVPNKSVRWCLAVIRVGVASRGALEGARAHRRGARS